MYNKLQLKLLLPSLTSRPPSDFRSTFGAKAFSPRFSALFAHCSGSRVFPLFLGCRLPIFNLTGHNIGHAFGPYVQVTRAFGVLFVHDASMGLDSQGFQGCLN